MNVLRRHITIAVFLVAVLAVMAAGPALGGKAAQAQGGVTWTVEYYDLSLIHI